MKQLLLILAFVCLCCNAQTLPLYYPDNYNVTGAYYKDMDNDLDKFTGTWEYINGTTSLRIVIEKRTEYYNSFGIYEDILVGEYRFIENGIEKINTLSKISDDSDGEIVHNIFGNIIIKKTAPPVCNDCGANERRVNLTILDPSRSDIVGLSGDIVLRRVDVGAIQKISLNLRQVGNIIYIDGNPPQYQTLSVPAGDYILTKVN